jgi:hypothetical protein
MRFRAPARDAVPRTALAHPVYASFARAPALLDGPWPTLADLNGMLGAPPHERSGARLSFVEQTPALLEDGLHYEVRIHEQGRIATRADNWHDLFNALMWMERRELKCAVNAAYVREAAAPRTAPRTRPQCALTHFDEAGAVVILRDAALLAPWDAHDWHGLLWRDRARWTAGATLVIFGHALLEHQLLPRATTVAKCVVVTGDVAPAAARRLVADRIDAGQLLCDPGELRPLPLAGMPGWHPDNAHEDFYREAACFRPLRPGRRYPPPLEGASPGGHD